MTVVFINYRKPDEVFAAALLDLKLSEHFGSEHVFLASRSITPGVDYEQAILAAAKECAVMIVVIGHRWIEALASRRHGTDWVVREISTATDAGALIVPVLLGDIEPLAEEALPMELKHIARTQYVRLSHRDIESSVRVLVDALSQAVPSLRWQPQRGMFARLLTRRRQ